MSDRSGAAATRDDVPRLRSWVAGAWRDGVRWREQLDPARPGTVVAVTAQADAALAAQAVDVARAAGANWRRTPADQRGDILTRTAALLDERAERIGDDLVREEGKTRPEAVGETRRAAQILRYFGAQAAFEPDGETFPARAPGDLLYARRVPIGVVAAITPWNFPIAIPAWKIAPALAYGNAVVWKPAELVPCTAVHLLQAFRDAGLPDGVLQMVLGTGAEIGPALVGTGRVDAVTFTGSNAVGRSILTAGAAAGQRLQLELGGVNAAIVLADADLDRSAQLVARGAFLSAGQKCTATSRIIVEEAVADAFAERVAAAADALVVGDPLAPGVDIGPLASEQRADEVRAALAGASAGRRLTRRAPDDVPAGAFVAPTIVAELPAGHRLLREETFGPVATLIRARDAAQAVALANDSEHGLTAGVFTRSLSAALWCADELDVGMVKINQETPGNDVHVPFGGAKASAYGPGEQGKAAREFFTRWKTVYCSPGS